MQEPCRCCQAVADVSYLLIFCLQVIAFILGRGALTLPLTFVQFAAVMLAPFMPAEIAADKVADSTPSGGLQRESTPTADANFAAAQLADFIPKGDLLGHISFTMLQRMGCSLQPWTDQS